MSQHNMVLIFAYYICYKFIVVSLFGLHLRKYYRNVYVSNLLAVEVFIVLYAVVLRSFFFFVTYPSISMIDLGIKMRHKIRWRYFLHIQLIPIEKK